MIAKGIGLLSCAAVLVMPLHAQPRPAAPFSANIGDSSAQDADATGLQRIIALRELGYADGIDLSGLSGTRDLFFPVPPVKGVRSLRLRLPYRSASAFDSRRSLQIDVGGNTLFTTSLPAEAQDGVIEVPIDPALIRDGFLAVKLRYSGAISDDRCVDQRVSGAYFNLAPGGGLTVGLAPEAVDSIGKVAAIMPRGGEIMLPANATPNQAAAAFTLAANGSDTRIVNALPQSEGSQWARSRFALAGADAGAVMLAHDGDIPEIRLGGEDPAAAARLLNTRWRALAASPMLAAAATSRDQPALPHLTFADLGADTSVQSVSDRGSWTIALPVTAIPADRKASALAIDVAVADDGSTTPAIVSVLMNGLLLGSAQADRGGRTHLQLDLPQGLLTARNSVEVAVTRQVRAGDCAYAPQGYPAQLLPSSHVVLAKAGAPVDFSDLAPVFAGGVTIVVPGPQALPPLRRLLTTLIDGATPVRVSYGEIPSKGPYVLVGAKPPPDAASPVRFDQGAVRIQGEGGTTLIDSGAMSRLTIAQLVRQGDRAVLWIRPGRDFGDLAGVDIDRSGLARGDVAFFDGDGPVLAFSTTRDRLVDINYPEQSSLADLLKRYRLWLIGLGWLIASIGFIYLLRRIYRPAETEG
ncbi:cellulose biosynthesis cyclic di-GMP-binding regulatory protein BcsB [Stakelama sp. CBK3Z-3]|uniref:Cyclic di-GMP-binding protein n=1 Tax=Stakelama flava TaxID=2860338 RepID=A0ABS6XP37_9SPHN|nr:cellulose biosynthesis cyclic di-GMP-binding regulatory protein BcsB [Stakelama flava]MBW4331983.1 cellulose biosynthesis cyclic di-GMP-binding regulatory protein BcsB [Stakelama flava]